MNTERKVHALPFPALTVAERHHYLGLARHHFPDDTVNYSASGNYLSVSGTFLCETPNDLYSLLAHARDRD
jgi:hypothetical protein